MLPAMETAPAKIILLGEHAVVYGRPAIAVPVTKLTATVQIIPEPEFDPGVVHVLAPDIHLEADLADLPSEHPINVAIRALMAFTATKQIPPCTMRISSTIPVASGMGSGAAVSAALFRSLATFLGYTLSDKAVSELTFEVEKIHHGIPSGIDNTVIAYRMPVYFIKGENPQLFQVTQPIHIIIGDTGIASPTAIAVADVRKAWLSAPHEYEAMFDEIGEISRSARTAIENGQIQTLGKLMDDNHAILQKMGVSSPELDSLVNAARRGGALGAKLSGGGRGGNMIAVIDPPQIGRVVQALSSAGARQTISTIVR